MFEGRGSGEEDWYCQNSECVFSCLLAVYGGVWRLRWIIAQFLPQAL